MRGRAAAHRGTSALPALAVTAASASRCGHGACAPRRRLGTRVAPSRAWEPAARAARHAFKAEVASPSRASPWLH